MKPLILLLIASAFGVTVHAQLKANAGPDKVWCLGASGPAEDTLIIGGNPADFFGTPPYHFEWTIMEPGYPALSYLNSDTIAKPHVIGVPAWKTLNVLHFILKVTDSNGVVSRDTTVVRYSRWGVYLPGNISKTEYDTIQLRVSVAFPSFPPVSYTWIPGLFLSDSFSSPPYCWADRFTNYYVTATDSLGCTSYAWGLTVFVHSTSVKNQSGNDEFLSMPNPITRSGELKCGPKWIGGKLMILSLNGSIEFQKEITTANTSLYFPGITAGMHIYRISGQGGLSRAGKIIYTE